MSPGTGHKPGRRRAAASGAAAAAAPAPPGYAWADLLEALVAEHGTWTALAWKLVERGAGPEDVASVERALRRLRARGQKDGGEWGVRVLRVFGVPASVAARLRWMGLYHSPFNDLPLPLCRDQLRLWDRPPISASRARLWLHLGLASCALRARAHAEAEAALGQARAALGGDGVADSERGDAAAARVEIALAAAYAASRTTGEGAVATRLAEAEAALAAGAADLGAADAACFHARLADQRAFVLNRRGGAADHANALALYQALPAADLHPFASYRRDAGLAYGLWRAGRLVEARASAARACRHAGDGGYVRLRVMGLLMVARVAAEPAERAAAVARARAMAERLEDPELLARVTRAEARADESAGPA